MWLNGFNDNDSGFPRSPCKHIPCSAPYMGDEQPGAPVDIGKGLQVSVSLFFIVNKVNLSEDSPNNLDYYPSNKHIRDPTEQE